LKETDLVRANVAFGLNKNESGLGSVIASGEGVQQGENTAVSQANSENHRSSDGKNHHSSDKQTPHVRPAFPSTSSKINGVDPVASVARGPVR